MDNFLVQFVQIDRQRRHQKLPTTNFFNQIKVISASGLSGSALEPTIFDIVRLSLAEKTYNKIIWNNDDF